MKGLLGKKVGMTQVFDDSGRQVPVTVVELGPCDVVQRKTAEKEGYDAVQLGFLDQKPQRLTKPARGHFDKNGVSAKRMLREFRVDESGRELEAGQRLDASLFEGVTHVDITARTKGRGFQGVVKRHGMSGGRASHGSGMHRKTGSIGQCVSPARVLKNRKLPGQMGNRRVTILNVEVVQLRTEDNLLLVRGGIPGPNGAVITVREALKKPAVS